MTWFPGAPSFVFKFFPMICPVVSVYSFNTKAIPIQILLYSCIIDHPLTFNTILVL